MEIAIVGEAPGAVEVMEGRPFVGPSGKLLTWLLKKADLRRTQIHLTNALLCRPTGSLDAYLKMCKKRKVENPLDCCRPRLIAELALSTVIVPTGNSALETLTGETGILKWRGSPIWKEELK